MITEHTDTCTCGAQITCSPHGDEWVWYDSDGMTWTYVLTHPLDRLIHDVVFRRNGMSWERLSTNELYSTARARYDLGGIPVHQHRGKIKAAGPVPDHCGLPMRLTPSGWVCRAVIATRMTRRTFEVTHCPERRGVADLAGTA